MTETTQAQVVTRADAIMAELRAWDATLQRQHAVVTSETIVEIAWGDLRLTLMGLWSALIQLDAATARSDAAERERDAMLTRLARFADAAESGFQRHDTETDVDDAASDVYQWARNYAYAIAHPDSGMGRVLLDAATTQPAPAGMGPRGLREGWSPNESGAS